MPCAAGLRDGSRIRGSFFKVKQFDLRPAAVRACVFRAALLAYDVVWWLTLGILSSIGFGTGLHSGLMFLWPFVIQTITTAEGCKSTSMPASYNHPCSLDCSGVGGDGSYSCRGRGGGSHAKAQEHKEPADPSSKLTTPIEWICDEMAAHNGHALAERTTSPFRLAVRSYLNG